MSSAVARLSAHADPVPEESGDDFVGMNWTQPKHSRGTVDRSGKAICNCAMIADRDLHLEIVDNWRSAHSYPLHAMTMSLRNRASSVDQDALIAQRLSAYVDQGQTWASAQYESCPKCRILEDAGLS